MKKANSTGSPTAHRRAGGKRIGVIGLLVFVAACLVLMGTLRFNSRSISVPSRNVLLITMDTTRADHLGAYGYSMNTSPTIDRLAREGIMFSKVIAQSAVTNSSHASIFTGLNPYRHRVRFLLDKRLAVLDDSFTTIAEVFRRSGASTGAFVSAVPASSDFGLDQGFDHFDEDFERDGTVNQRAGDQTAEAAVAYLEQVTEPFFVWVHFFDPHDPKLIPPSEVCAPFKPKRIDDEEAKIRAVYDAEIRFMDMQIQKVLDALTRKGVSDRTILALVSDHGEGLGEHDWWQHGIIYQEQVHVPMILVRPEGPSGRRIDRLVRTIDLMPTLLEWAEIDQRLWPETDGVPLTPLLDEANREFVTYAYCDSTNMQNYTHRGKSTLKTDKFYCVMDDRWKLIHHQLRPSEGELYDLIADPDEALNLYSVEVQVVDRLTAELMSRDPMIDEISGMEALSPEMIAKLKSLGYIE